MKRANAEVLLVEEFAAALADVLAESVREKANEATMAAVRELGADDGDEVVLPESLANAEFAGEVIAEALMDRPEMYAALASVGTLLVKRLKTGA